MATATQTPQAPATPQAPETTNQTSERTDYTVGYKLKEIKKDGSIGADLAEKEATFFEIGTEAEALLVKGYVDQKAYAPSFTVTVSIPRAKNYAGIKEICPDEEEAAANFNRGAKQKANNRLAAKLTAIDEDGNLLFDPAGSDKDGTPYLSNGVLDMTSEIASPSRRKVLTEEEKLDRFLEQFPEATRNMMKQAYLASRQAPGA